MKRFLTIEEVAERYAGTSVKAIHDKTRTNRIPHIKRTGFRKIMFDPDHLDAWDKGCVLRVIKLDDGSRIVRPYGPDEIKEEAA